MVELSSSNWIDRRAAGVWYTDGQQDFLHMHALAAVEEQRKHYSINLNGFWGDALLGGLYRGGHPKHWPAYPYSHWFTPQKFNNRGGRFINEGTRLTNNFIQNRLPYCENRLATFAYSVPAELMEDYKVFRKALIRSLPKFFKTIPWQKSGVPISYPPGITFAAKKLLGARRRIGKLAERVGVKLKSLHQFDDYPTWIRQSPARALFERVLLSPSAHYGEFISALAVRRSWDEHMRGLDRTEELCRALTFELWLQQVFEQNYRSGISESDLSR